MGTSPSELSYIAKKIEKTGIDGIEIGFACPMGEGQDIIAGDPERVYTYTCEVVKAVHVPVSVKLSAAVGNLSACLFDFFNGARKIFRPYILSVSVLQS